MLGYTKYGITKFYNANFICYFVNRVVGIQENTKVCTTLWYILQCKVYSASYVKIL
jgi:hypothetical protein